MHKRKRDGNRTGSSRRGAVLWRLVVAAACLINASCVFRNPHYNPEQPHHTWSGFRNNYSDDMPGGFGFLRWQWHRWWNDLPKPAKAPIEAVKPELDFIRNNRDATAVTWIGHATVLLQMGGLNILTDPHFS